MIEAKKRIEFIDLAKGICILLIIVGHSGVEVDYPGLSAMRTPLYLTLSGLFFKDYGGFTNILIRKTNKILIPYSIFLYCKLPAFLSLQCSVSGAYCK